MCIRYYHFLTLLHGYWIASPGSSAERRAEQLDTIDLHCLAAFTPNPQSIILLRPLEVC